MDKGIDVTETNATKITHNQNPDFILYLYLLFKILFCISILDPNWFYDIYQPKNVLANLCFQNRTCI